MTTIRVNESDALNIITQGENSILPGGEKVKWHKVDNRIWEAEHAGKSYRLLLLSVDEAAGQMEVRLNGKRMVLAYESLAMKLQKTIGIEPGAGLKVTELKAPMPGLIRGIPVAVGDAVPKGEPLLVLEAMKMENVIKAPVDVTIAEIHVKEEATVEKNQLLITFA